MPEFSIHAEMLEVSVFIPVRGDRAPYLNQTVTQIKNLKVRAATGIVNSWNNSRFQSA